MLRNFIKLIPNKRYTKCLLINTNKIHTNFPKLAEEEPQTVDIKHVNRINEVLGKYTAEQEEKILKIVNNYNLNELLGYEVYIIPNYLN